MKVLILYDEKHIGGTQTYVDAISSYLNSHRVKITQRAGSHVNKSDIYQFIRKEYDCIFVHLVTPKYVFLVVYAWLFGIPIVTTLHGIWVRESLSRKEVIGLRKFVNLWFAQYLLCILSRKIIVLSEYAKELTNKTFPNIDRKLVIIPGGVDTKKFHPLKIKHRNKLKELLFLPPTKFLFTYIARLEKRKGLKEALGAFSYYLLHQPDSYLCILYPVGKYSQIEILNEIIAMNRMKSIKRNIRFIPMTNQTEVIEFLQVSDALIMSSISLEMFGLLTLEAMATGCVPVMYSNNGLAPIVKNINEKMVASRLSVNSLGKALLHVNSMGPRKRADLRRSVRAVSLDYDWEVVSKSVLGVLKNVIK